MRVSFQCLVQICRRRTRTLFNHLLVSALNRALSLPKVDSITLTVAEYLNLDVVACWVVLLDEQVTTFEQSFACDLLAVALATIHDNLTSRLHHTKAFFDIVGLLTDNQAHATASSRCFQHDWVAEFLALFESIIFASYKAFRARHNGDTSFLSEFSSYMLDTKS